LLLLQQIIAIEISFSAEIPDRRPFGEQKDGEASAVLSLYCEVLRKHGSRRALLPRKSSSAKNDEAHVCNDIVAVAYCQFNK
jgi:hypothetical protein